MLSNPKGQKVSQTLPRLLRVIIGLAVFVLAGLVCFFWLNNYFKSTPTVVQPIAIRPNTAPTKPVANLTGIPLQLKITAISVDAVVAQAGLTADGSMDIKKDPTQVAWYNLGPRPGEIGSAVIAGHYGFINGKGSVFNDIHTLIKGDKITVVDDKGIISTFAVTTSRSYDPTADASSVFKSSDGKAHLNLITCEGTWSPTQQSYSNRLVIFSDKVAN